jgi:hypothetical protein
MVRARYGFGDVDARKGFFMVGIKMNEKTFD